MYGKFIVFEGLDGSGKTLQANLLKERLLSEGHKVYLTSEPSDGPAGHLLRQVLSGRIQGEENLIAGLYVADRLDHLHNPMNGVLKKLEEGYIVISDRYFLSSCAYQGLDFDDRWIEAANSLALSSLHADLTIFLELTAERAMSRREESANSKECFEKVETLKRVEQNYKKAIGDYGDMENVVGVDAYRESYTVFHDVYDEVENLMLVGNQKEL